MRYRPPHPDAIVLELHAGVLEARGRDDPPGSGISADWSQLSLPAGRSSSRGRSPLLRAIGDARSVMDVTGGFGVDAWTMARSGHTVRIVERSPIMAALLLDALERGRQMDPEAAARITIDEGDARPLLAAVCRDAAPDAVYLDPMFPPKRRASALPSKQMQFLAALVGPDLDAPELLAAARGVARQRVVVKRPPHAEPLAPGASHTIESKLLRFDVYAVTHERRPTVSGGARS